MILKWKNKYTYKIYLSTSVSVITNTNPNMFHNQVKINHLFICFYWIKILLINMMKIVEIISYLIGDEWLAIINSSFVSLNHSFLKFLIHSCVQLRNSIETRNFCRCPFWKVWILIHLWTVPLVILQLHVHIQFIVNNDVSEWIFIST